MIKRIWLIITILLFLIGLVFVAVTVLNIQNTSSLIDIKENKIEQLKKEVVALEKELEEKEFLAKQNKHSSAIAGSNVATLQNKISSLHIKSQQDAYADLAKQLMAYSDDEVFIRPWFYYTKHSVTLNWQFKSAYSFKDDYMDVVWLGVQRASNKVLAITTARYDAKRDKFTNVKLHELDHATEYRDAERDVEYEGIINEVLKGLKT